MVVEFFIEAFQDLAEQVIVVNYAADGVQHVAAFVVHIPAAFLVHAVMAYNGNVVFNELAGAANVILVKRLGIDGAAWSSLIAFTVYNIIRLAFLWKRFKMQPFSVNTFYVLVHALTCYAVCYLLFNGIHGFWGMVLRSAVFVVLFVVSAFQLKISPDIDPVWKTVKKKLSIR